jgi:hypothetical protein
VKRLRTEMTEKSHERRAIIIGGSIAGLFIGAFLRALVGASIFMSARRSSLIGRGVGIFATHLELLEVMDKCGAGTVCIGVIVYKRITLDCMKSSRSPIAWRSYRWPLIIVYLRFIRSVLC